jgi:hypothetical protein
MGTWSKPMFVTVSPLTPDDYVIDVSDFDETTLNEWRHGAFMCDDQEKTQYTLNEFMDTQCDTHKIMDYMGNAAIRRWLKLFTYLYTKYADLENLAFHFFCIDSQEPYYFTWNRTIPDELNMHIVSEQNMFCFKPEERQKHEDCSGCSECGFGYAFDQSMYLQNWKKIACRVLRLKVNPNSWY